MTNESAPETAGGQVIGRGCWTVRARKIDYAVFQSRLYGFLALGTCVLSYMLKELMDMRAVLISPLAEALNLSQTAPRPRRKGDVLPVQLYHANTGRFISEIFTLQKCSM